MKYTNLSKTLTLVFHSLIAVAFGALGFYFAFFVVPYFLMSDPLVWRANLFDASYYLYLEFGTLGLAFFVLSAIGAYHSFKSFGLSGQKSDEEVVKSFNILIAEGWIAGLILMLDAAVLFDTLGTGSIAFPIVLCVLCSIIVLIGTNIPMVKLYDNKDQKPLIKTFLFAGIVAFASLTANTAFTMIGYATGTVSGFTSGYLFNQVAIVFAISLLVLIVLVLTRVFLKPERNNGLIMSVGFGVSMGIVGIGFMILGILDLVWGEDLAVHLIGSQNSGFAFTGYGYGVMSIVVGVLLMAGAIAIAASFLLPKKEKAHRA